LPQPFGRFAKFDAPLFQRSQHAFDNLLRRAASEGFVPKLPFLGRDILL